MIQRRLLRDDVYEAILDAIGDGRHAPGEPLSDITLSQLLGVSRTPVREALLRLEQEGVLQSRPGHGFEVRPLSRKEISDKYPVLWTLESLALELSPAPTAEYVESLRAVNREMRRRGLQPRELLDLDARWHELLVARSGNETLLTLLGSLRSSLRRYELVFMHGMKDSRTSTEHHEKVTSAIERGDLAEAKRWLLENWRQTVEFYGRSVGVQ
jgi:DNA-binding GntR family transcriptional regulator